MNTTPNPPDYDTGGFDSRDIIIIIDDGPGDSTPRPCNPKFLKQAMMEREKIEKWGKLVNDSKPPDIIYID